MYLIQIKPLSVNKAWQGKRFKTQDYIHFSLDTQYLLPRFKLQRTTNLGLKVEFGFSTRASDIDNCLKTFIDQLVRVYKFDDREIYELKVYKSIVPKGQEYISFEFFYPDY